MCSKANDLARHAAFSKELYIHIDMAMHSTVHESLVDRGWAAGTKIPETLLHMRLRVRVHI